MPLKNTCQSSMPPDALQRLVRFSKRMLTWYARRMASRYCCGQGFYRAGVYHVRNLIPTPAGSREKRYMTLSTRARLSEFRNSPIHPVLLSQRLRGAPARGDLQRENMGVAVGQPPATPLRVVRPSVGDKVSDHFIHPEVPAPVHLDLCLESYVK